MKNIQLLLLLIGLTSAYNMVSGQSKFGIRAGVGFSNVVEKAENGEKASTQSIPGLTLGLTAEIALAGDFYLQPALLYSRRGFKQQSGGFGSATNLKVKADYLELPVNFLYKPKLGTGSLLLGAGPYIAYGTGGSWKSDTDILIGDIRENGEGRVAFRNDGSVRNDSEYTYGRPFDYGLNATLGYEFRERFSLQLTGMVGIANLVPHFNGYQRGGSIRNKGFGVSLGYKL
ncbi:PorT family protein [Pedobacter sp. ISL-68]|uniref:porin family protein n=1 Tax=unclassified Pedobacter TaxID=2628915 RepID=UPI001BE64656|nr:MULTISPECIES: porin family protein [unclassified Pedobacter]MBT2560159.1 PorT family protein [Pedobacter sp. ISL-64]MBT2589138.1 PorT family protein [Pedobacter sp. ISL-68]